MRDYKEIKAEIEALKDELRELAPKNSSETVRFFNISREIDILEWVLEERSDLDFILKKRRKIDYGGIALVIFILAMGIALIISEINNC